MKIAFIDARLGSTDGVSLETDKWVKVLEKTGNKIYFIVGEYNNPPENTYIIPEMGFFTPDNLWIQDHAFNINTDKQLLYDKINDISTAIAKKIKDIIDKENIDLLILENCITIPMQIPLGLAIKKLLASNPIAAIAHHHDFYWERERFLNNNVQDILDEAFPVNNNCINHVVINSLQKRDLKTKFKIDSTVIPNVFDFESPLNRIDEFNFDFKTQLNLDHKQIIFLQPSRIVPRKAIENTIEMVYKLNDDRIKLLLAGYSGDEGEEYKNKLESMIKQKHVRAMFIDDHVSSFRVNSTPKKYQLWDCYVHSNLVTFPSEYEGFGNHVVEAFYFKKPLFVNNYSVFKEDILPTGVDVILMDGSITDEVIEKTKLVLANSSYKDSMVQNNFEIGKKHFSFYTLEKILLDIIKNHKFLNKSLL